MSLQIQSSKAMGDPGIFGAIGRGISRVAKTAVGIAGEVLPGPAGTIARAAGRTLWKPSVAARAQPRTGTAAAAVPVRRALPTARPLARLPFRPPVTVDFNGARPSGVIDQRVLPAIDETQLFKDVTPAVSCPKGFKPNKSTYYRRVLTPGGPPEGQLVLVTPGSRCVRIRKRNAANPRAMDRALGRIKSGKRFARKMGQVTVRDPCSCARRRKK
ncbi:MAG: hypothetical protein ACYTBJ_23460 [Planctomycetota bacterium]|jgi:hypothetical protein